MYAHVYPLLRLPRRFGIFDYVIPEGMTVAPGDIVRVPFKHRSVLAVVAACDTTTDVQSALSSIEHVAWQGAMATDDVTRLVHLATRLAQSPSSLFFHTFGTLKDGDGMPRLAAAHGALAFHKELVETVREALTATARTVTAQLALEGACLLAQKLRERHHGQLLVLAPMEREAELLARVTPLGEATAVLHGKTPPKERERILRAWRNGTLRTLVGTRQAALIPAERLDAIVVTSSGCTDHFNDRRNPRFDTRNAAVLQATQHHARLFLVDPLPRPEDIVMTDACVWAAPIDPVIVDIKRPEAYSDFPLISAPLLDAIKNALQSQKSVLLSFNRKGTAKRAQCRACAAIVLCDACQGTLTPGKDKRLACARCGNVQSLPEACPVCTHGKLSLRGIGNVHLEEALRSAFPGVTVDRIEKGRPVSDARIVIVTEYFFTSVMRPFAEKRYGLVAEVCIDLAQHVDDFRSSETMARKLHRLARFAQQQGAHCLVQTWLPDVVTALCDGERAMREECALRAQYHLPPAHAIMTIRHADAAAMTALTGITFLEKPEAMSCVGRIPPDVLDEHTARLATLPDTAVLTIDTPYVHHDGAHQ